MDELRKILQEQSKKLSDDLLKLKLKSEQDKKEIELKSKEVLKWLSNRNENPFAKSELSEWQIVMKELGLSIYQLENLINQIKLKHDVNDFDIHVIEGQHKEFKVSMSIINIAKNINEVKDLTNEVIQTCDKIKDQFEKNNLDLKLIDQLKGELILLYADNPSMGKDRFKFLLGELIRIEKKVTGQDDKMRVIDLVKNDLTKWK